MISRTIDELLNYLRRRRQEGEPPPVLLLGAGASTDAGIGGMRDLIKFCGYATLEEFAAFMTPLEANERYTYLAKFLQTLEPSVITPGYRALAALCADQFFDLVMSTNLDPLLEDALAGARLWRRDYLLLVNGAMRPDRLGWLLGASRPRLKVLKLHGDLFLRSMAWTPSEMDLYAAEIAEPLKHVLWHRDILVVGHRLYDEPLRKLILDAEGSIWYTHMTEVPPYLRESPRVRAVISAQAGFERLFPEIARRFEVPVASDDRSEPPRDLPGRQALPGARTMDEVTSAVVAIAGPDRSKPDSTAFLIEAPRVIVSDANAAKRWFDGDRAWIIADEGSQETRVVRTSRASVFGPAVLAAPSELRVAGLRVDPAPVTAGDRLQVIVTAGERTGISRATVPQGSEETVAIDGIPAPVSGLVRLECSMRPGASGAPVIDDALNVRGFIVAASVDAGVATAFMLPSRHWVAALGPAKQSARRLRTQR
jgi:hypothetical protein